MMELDYGMQLSFEPIPLSIGLLRKPKLKDIAQISFRVFSTYEFFVKCTPKMYYTKALSESGGTDVWNGFPDDKKESMTMYSIIASDTGLQSLYVSIFNFFFEEKVVYKDGFFILFNDDDGQIQADDIPTEHISGIISGNNFQQVCDIIQQICCIHSKADVSVDGMKFKSESSRKRYEKMLKAMKEQEEQKADMSDRNLSIPNIISSVAGMHPNYNLINIWELTIFQLMDAFRRLQSNAVYDIVSVRASVWGDERKQFDHTLWYKNYYDTDN